MTEHDPLQEAVALAKSGRKAEARQILIGLLRQDSDNYRYWLVMAQVVEDKQDAFECMEQVVRLRPDDPKMRRILEKLEAEVNPPPVSPDPPEPLWDESPPQAETSWSGPPPVETPWSEPLFTRSDRHTEQNDPWRIITPIDEAAPPEPAYQPPNYDNLEDTFGAFEESAATFDAPPQPAAPPAPPRKAKAGGGSSRSILLIGLGAAAIFVFLIVGALLLRNVLAGSSSRSQTVGQAPAQQQAPAELPTATALPTPTATPLPDYDPALLETEDTLAHTFIAPVDMLDWLVGSSLIDPSVPRTSSSSPSYRVGSQRTFWVIAGGYLYQQRATLQVMNDGVAMWVENGYNVDQAELSNAAYRFANEIVPTVHDVFGEEWSPGVDNDPRLHILHVFSLGPNVAGQFVFVDEYTQEVYSYSNEMEMFYISLWASEVGSDQYLSTLAHEFQHMVRWHNDINEDIWLNEGLSQLAERVAGFDTAFTHYNYLYDSRTQLNAWSEDFRESYSHYGAAYLFSLYLWERFGTEVVSQIAEDDAGGLMAIEAVLNEQGTSVDEVFADWIVANYLDDTGIVDGRYGYELETLTPICPRHRAAETQTQPRRSMAQYTANYIELEGSGDFTIDFKGDPEVGLIPTTPKSGQFIFWSNRADGSTMTLSRTFDLSGLESATLQYWAWYDLQEDGDFGFVKISQDGGQTWDFLQATSSTTTDYLFIDAVDSEKIPLYTGTSGGSSEYPSWLWEEVDLSPYVGREVIIRFEYVTSISYTGYGWALDNIRIPELDYFYDVEEEDLTWNAQGFIRTNNRLPEKWALRLIEYGDQTTVTPVEVYADGRARINVSIPPEVGRATLIIGAMAPTTKVEAQYQIDIGGTGQLASLQNPPGVLYQDDFESPCGDFISFVLPDYAFGYKNGRYEISTELEDFYIWGNTHTEYRNITVEVDTTFVEPKADTTMGVLCRFEDDWNFTSFEIRNDGTYRVFVVDDGYFYDLIDWTETGAINTGAGASNHLKAICNNKQLVLFINGDRVADAEVDLVTEGAIGFSATTYDEGGILVAFDNLVASRPQ